MIYKSVRIVKISCCLSSREYNFCTAFLELLKDGSETESFIDRGVRLSQQRWRIVSGGENEKGGSWGSPVPAKWVVPVKADT